MNETRNSPGTDPGVLAEAIRKLPRDLPPDGLARDICLSLEQLPAPRRSLWRRLMSWADRPSLVLAYRLATLGLLAGIFAGVWSLVAVRRGAEAPPVPTGAGPALASRAGSPPAVHPAGVTFVFYAPEASSVAVVGSFNDWDPGRYPMVRDADGNWKVRVDLPPGQYEYQFVVDGSHFVPDPRATEQRDDGLGGSNAVLRI